MIIPLAILFFATATGLGLGILVKFLIYGHIQTFNPENFRRDPIVSSFTLLFYLMGNLSASIYVFIKSMPLRISHLAFKKT